MKEDLLKHLRKLTGKKNVILTKRGNTALKEAINIAKQRGFITMLLPDQGIWMTCKDYTEKADFRVVELKTDDGIIDIEELKEYKQCALLIQTYAGYFANQPMDEIKELCKDNEMFLIEDATPALGDKLYGDIIVSSFGKGKPVNLGTGGLIAHNYPNINIAESFEGNEDELMEKLEKLDYRMNQLKKICRLIKMDLNTFDILHRDKLGINIVIAYENDSQKNYILNYCDKMNYEYTECPRYIRVNRQAISIEVKRLETP